MMSSQLVTTYLGLGSNLEDRRRNLEMAIDFLSERLKIEQCSPIYDTSPVGDANQPRFLNMVIKVVTRLPAATLLFMAKGIEAKLGRVPIGSPRPIDIDLLFYGEQIINSPPNLVVPHPKLHERAFVLVPLADLAPDLVHPVVKKKIKDLKELAEGKEDVKLYGSYATKT